MIKYKGRYRLKVPYDKSTNQFSRKLNGTLEDIDMYIDCYNGNKVYYYGRNTLEAYIPSLGRGHNIIKTINDIIGEDKIRHIIETDKEIIFRFSANNNCTKQIISLLKPKTSGANISPFSNKNLPRNKNYEISDNELNIYKEIVAKIPKEHILDVSHITKDFIKSLATKKYTYDMIKDDMAKKCLNGKEYIHCIGKWNEYIEYLKNNLSCIFTK